MSFACLIRQESSQEQDKAQKLLPCLGVTSSLFSSQEQIQHAKGMDLIVYNIVSTENILHDAQAVKWWLNFVVHLSF